MVVNSTACNQKEEKIVPTINLVTKEWVNYNHYVLGRAIFKKDTLKAYFKLRGGMSVRYEKKIPFIRSWV